MGDYTNKEQKQYRLIEEPDKVRVVHVPPCAGTWR
jgi:hypothetical protein